MPIDTRAAAAHTIAQVMAGKSLNNVMPPMLDKVNTRDRGLLQQLCYGSLRHYPRLMGLLRPLLAKPLREKDNDVLALLLVGIYQLEETRVPSHAAVSATVAATRAMKKPWARGLTNGVLRNFQRQRDALIDQLDAAQACAHPQWLYQLLQQEWPEQAQSIIEANNQQPPMTLRVNQQKTSRDAYLLLLQEQEIESTACAISPQGIRLTQAVDVSQLPGFEEGLVSVQDEAAQMAAILLDAQPGERVLDACSAPGGKTCHILEQQSALQELIAMDVSPLRLEKVEENLHRLDLQAAVLPGDGSAPPAELEAGSFDRILVDAPCSASGVIRRHPDVKLLRLEGDISSLGQQQSAILQGLWPLLKPGGTLLYATCSVLDGENSAVIERFLADTPQASYLPATADWGRQQRYGRQLLPTVDGPDGLFYSILTKQA
jgi:16S rRNA (cytosine967-C5)-methyltransferase